jgi:hypothetical protein
MVLCLCCDSPGKGKLTGNMWGDLAAVQCMHGDGTSAAWCPVLGLIFHIWYPACGMRLNLPTDAVLCPGFEQGTSNGSGLSCHAAAAGIGYD